MEIPLLETTRLLLREFRESDLDDFARICADPLVMRYVGQGKPLSLQETWRQIAFLIGHWELRGFGMWAVQSKSTGKLLGRVGFHQPGDWPGFEIGWLMDRQFWGQGLATEGARAAIELAVPRFGQRHVISLIHPDNAPSIRVAQKLGESLEGESEIHGNTVLRYGIYLNDE